MRKNLIAARQKQKLTKGQLAPLVGISVKQYNRLEAGTSDGSVKVWERLKKTLKAKSIDFLLEQEANTKEPDGNPNSGNVGD